MKMLINTGITVALLLQATLLYAAAAPNTQVITSALQRSQPGIAIESITPSPINGIYQVHIANGPIIYATADGGYFIAGDLFAVKSEGFINLAEREREARRSELLAGISTDDKIIFSPTLQPTQTTITVFTDVDCFYCQKLHNEVPELNRLGIAVHYLAYPRAGIGSESYNKIASAWCNSNPRQALTDLKARRTIPINVCANNPVAAQFELGQRIGITGTPAIITTSGQLIPGYMSAQQLAEQLGINR